MTSLAARTMPADDAAAIDTRTSEHPAPRRYVPMLHRVAGINALLVVAAVVVTIVILAPQKISSLALDEEVAVVLVAVVLVVFANVLVLRRVIGPVQALTAFARRVDLSNLGERIPAAQPSSEAGELALTFNEMLARLEQERREATGRVLRAQEDERLRIAQELHDQVGQDLTAVLLGLSQISSEAPPGLRADVVAVQDGVRGSLEDVRRIAVELRPEALDDLGIASALSVLVERFSRQLGIAVTERIDDDLPPLRPEIELVLYRVAQEALTNAARHSVSGAAEVALERQDARLVLTVRDYGSGLPADNVAGTGMRGMRERAALVGGRLRIGNHRSGTGCEVRLELPLEDHG